MVLDSLLLAQHRIQTFCVEVAVINLVPPRLQSLDDLAIEVSRRTSSDRIAYKTRICSDVCVPPRARVVRQRGPERTAPFADPASVSGPGRQRWPES